MFGIKVHPPRALALLRVRLQEADVPLPCFRVKGTSVICGNAPLGNHPFASLQF